ncbi:glycerol-3-phosphate dehydrogenase [Chelatococcus reniformis]|uniref:Glycerol-3-phosphate dehydrogenase n=1 Tax=Chelatococcus reniformis TaxID=1494448 RepID=A0A916TYK6_9HYPH|nr:glycerol-3-phosphate dehydrogenase [Chelatococcus reniformis]GGC49542.1 glycerol-3-phosphate dehydrogenase [Chelatococcus reniformis]
MDAAPRNSGNVFDLGIIGGGVNGCGIARDAAGRGASVVLFEQDDLASATSSASTKLIHGGLRYLEQYAFRLVHEALTEREVLWRMAPHIVRPLRFVLPHHEGLRPAWLLRLGLFLYDHLGGRKLLPPTRSLDLAHDPAGEPLKDSRARAFEYSDCWVEDSRLVVLNGADAAGHGADIRTQTKVVSAARKGGLWRIETEQDGRRASVEARVLVNAAGPWVGSVLSGIVHSSAKASVRMVKGSHIVVRKLFAHDRCYIFQNADGRIVFAIPYEHDFTLIGTTDLDFHDDPAAVAISAAEVDYLCSAASEYFREPVTRDKVVWTYSGVRPLYDDGASRAQEATRDYVLTLDAPGGEPPLLSVFGGKITTYRRLAEAAIDKLAPHAAWAGRPAWTKEACLPGGDFPVDGLDALAAAIGAEQPWLGGATIARLARAYGTKAHEMLAGARSVSELGRHFGADLYEAEVRYLMRAEFARRAADVLWRRGKLGLRLSVAQREALDDFMRTVDGATASRPHGTRTSGAPREETEAPNRGRGPGDPRRWSVSIASDHARRGRAPGPAAQE